jgi:hypothetical protein
MWVSELRLGGVKRIAGEATLCIDTAGAPVLRGNGAIAASAGTIISVSYVCT